MANTAIRTPALPDDRAAEEAWKAHELRVLGWPLRRIGQALGMSAPTVSKRLAWAQKQLLLPMVVEYRQIQTERLENLLALTLEKIREPVMVDGVPAIDQDGNQVTRLDLEKVRTARALINDLSDLHGVKAAVEVTHRMLEITEEDLALVEQINADVRARMEAGGWSTPEPEDAS